jgi:uncharacterized protein YlbG (UPF0298 family)
MCTTKDKICDFFFKYFLGNSSSSDFSTIFVKEQNVKHILNKCSETPIILKIEECGKMGTKWNTYENPR